MPANPLRNELTRCLGDLRSAGVPIVDLTESNPTRIGILYPPDLLAPLAADASLRYAPEPFGLMEARRAIAADVARRGAAVDASRILLTSSTSESYSWLFKLLCDPGDCVLVPTPSYPLFEHLTALEGVTAVTYGLEYHGQWEIDTTSIEAAPPGTRALVVVSPNNPTGSYISPSAFQRIAALCRERSWALIADEVFADYCLEAEAPLTDLACREPPCLTFTLGGASKSLGLPQVKLGWIVAGGPADLREAALQHLEFVADTFLSVGTPVQQAAAALLAAGAEIRTAIRERVSGNLGALRRTAAAFPAVTVLRVEGGWSAVLRVPATRGEERLVLDLLRGERILAYPGYFFDFRFGEHLIVSLLPPREQFDEALPRLLRSVC